VSNPPVLKKTLDELRTLDTPTVCNALELTSPERRIYGFTVSPLVCIRPELPPMVGFARTATISAIAPDTVKGRAAREKRDGYYEYMGSGPDPGITVIQDVDGEKRGFGAWWGEVNSNIHKGLGSLGLITDGSVRDLPDIAEGFQMLAGSVGPSHAWVHVEEYDCEVEIFAMKVSPGDLIHADQHGALVGGATHLGLVRQTKIFVARGLDYWRKRGYLEVRRSRSRCVIVALQGQTIPRIGG